MSKNYVAYTASCVRRCKDIHITSWAVVLVDKDTSAQQELYSKEADFEAGFNETELFAILSALTALNSISSHGLDIEVVSRSTIAIDWVLGIQKPRSFNGKAAEYKKRIDVLMNRHQVKLTLCSANEANPLGRRSATLARKVLSAYLTYSISREKITSEAD